MRAHEHVYCGNEFQLRVVDNDWWCIDYCTFLQVMLYSFCWIRKWDLIFLLEWFDCFKWILGEVIGMIYPCFHWVLQKVWVLKWQAKGLKIFQLCIHGKQLCINYICLSCLQGGEFIDFLQNKYLPTLHLAPQLIQVNFQNCFVHFESTDESKGCVPWEVLL